MGKIVDEFSNRQKHHNIFLFGHILFLLIIMNYIAFHFPGFDSLTLESHCRLCTICEVMLMIFSLRCFQGSWKVRWLSTGFLSEISSRLKFGRATDMCRFFIKPHCQGLEIMQL